MKICIVEDEAVWRDKIRAVIEKYSRDKNILFQIESEFRKEVHIRDRVEIFRELALEQIETALITNEILKRIRVCVTDNIDQDETIMATTACVAHTQRNVKTNEVIELYRIPEIHLTESLLNDFPVFYILQVLIHEFGHFLLLQLPWPR